MLRPLCPQLVFDMLVLQKHNTEMTVAAGEALYTLVCLHQVSEEHRHPEAPVKVSSGQIQNDCTLVFGDI